VAQAVSHLPLTAEDRVRAWLSPCGISGERSGSWIRFFLSSSVFPCQYNFTLAPHTHIPGGRAIGPLVAAVQRRSLTASTRITIEQLCFLKPFFANLHLYVDYVFICEISGSPGGDYEDDRHHWLDDGGSTHLWNIGLLKRDYIALCPRNLSSPLVFIYLTYKNISALSSYPPCAEF
jgi:hypothetical protein